MIGIFIYTYDYIVAVTATSIVKMTNKKTGVTYVYESTSYWDKDKHQARNKRKLIGKLDPVTGEIVPTGRRGSATWSAAADQEPLTAVDGSSTGSILDERDAEILELRKKILELEMQLSKKTSALDRIRRALESSE